MENTEITITGCSDCPFHTDDSDYGESCYHGVDISYKLKKEDQIHVRHGVGGCVSSSIPKKCPMLQNTFTIKLLNIYKQ